MNQKSFDTNNNNNNARPASQNPTAAPRPRTAAADSGRLNASQRNTFRMMLATASTVAVVISAQAMATLDRSATAAQPTVAVSGAVASVPTVVASATPSTTTAKKNTSAAAVQSSVSQPRPVSRSSRG